MTWCRSNGLPASWPRAWGGGGGGPRWGRGGGGAPPAGSGVAAVPAPGPPLRGGSGDDRPEPRPPRAPARQRAGPTDRRDGNGILRARGAGGGAGKSPRFRRSRGEGRDGRVGSIRRPTAGSSRPRDRALADPLHLKDQETRQIAPPQDFPTASRPSLQSRFFWSMRDLP